MGLDMYLTAKKYLWSSREEDQALAKKISELIGVDGDPSLQFSGASLTVKEIALSAMYWRKANAIHGWFVDNVQDGEDECQEHYVSREKLQELIDECKAVLEDPDAEDEADRLEPRGGFFFGSTDKDEYYYDDLKHTVEGLTRALSLPESFEFYYCSSW